MSTRYVAVEPIADSTPGFSFSRSGTCNSGTYLQADAVPSNLAGRIVPFSTAELTRVFIVCDSDATFDVEIQKRSGMTFTTIYTASMISTRKNSFFVEDVELILEDEICVKIGSGSTSNVIVGLIIKGSSL